MSRENRSETYAKMVGRKYGRLTVIEFDGTRRICKALAITARCECGDVRDYPAYTVLSGHTASCPACRRATDTLCWRCANACSQSKCSWAGGVPRKDWTARKTIINTEKDRSIESYHVIKCPGFEPENRRRK